MSSILLAWCNQVLNPKYYINSLEDDFSNGYLFGAILFAFNQIDNWPASFVNRNDRSDVIHDNFMSLYPVFSRLAIPFNSLIVKDITGRRPGAAAKVLFQLKSKLDALQSVPINVVGRPRVKNEGGSYPLRDTISASLPAFQQRQMKSTKPAFDTFQEAHFESRMRALSGNQKQISEAQKLSKFQIDALEEYERNIEEGKAQYEAYVKSFYDYHRRYQHDFLSRKRANDDLIAEKASKEWQRHQQRRKAEVGLMNQINASLERKRHLRALAKRAEAASEAYGGAAEMSSLAAAQGVRVSFSSSELEQGRENIAPPTQTLRRDAFYAEIAGRLGYPGAPHEQNFRGSTDAAASLQNRLHKRRTTEAEAAAQRTRARTELLAFVNATLEKEMLDTRLEFLKGITSTPTGAELLLISAVGAILRTEGAMRDRLRLATYEANKRVMYQTVENLNIWEASYHGMRRKYEEGVDLGMFRSEKQIDAREQRKLAIRTDLERKLFARAAYVTQELRRHYHLRDNSLHSDLAHSSETQVAPVLPSTIVSSILAIFATDLPLPEALELFLVPKPSERPFGVVLPETLLEAENSISDSARLEAARAALDAARATLASEPSQDASGKKRRDKEKDKVATTAGPIQSPAEILREAEERLQNEIARPKFDYASILGKDIGDKLLSMLPVAGLPMDEPVFESPLPRLRTEDNYDGKHALLHEHVLSSGRDVVDLLAVRDWLLQSGQWHDFDFGPDGHMRDAFLKYMEAKIQAFPSTWMDDLKYMIPALEEAQNTQSSEAAGSKREKSSRADTKRDSRTKQKVTESDVFDANEPVPLLDSGIYTAIPNLGNGMEIASSMLSPVGLPPGTAAGGAREGKAPSGKKSVGRISAPQSLFSASDSGTVIGTEPNPTAMEALQIMKKMLSRDPESLESNAAKGCAFSKCVLDLVNFMAIDHAPKETDKPADAKSGKSTGRPSVPSTPLAPSASALKAESSVADATEAENPTHINITHFSNPLHSRMEKTRLLLREAMLSRAKVELFQKQNKDPLAPPESPISLALTKFLPPLAQWLSSPLTQLSLGMDVDLASHVFGSVIENLSKSAQRTIRLIEGPGKEPKPLPHFPFSFSIVAPPHTGALQLTNLLAEDLKLAVIHPRALLQAAVALAWPKSKAYKQSVEEERKARPSSRVISVGVAKGLLDSTVRTGRDVATTNMMNPKRKRIGRMEVPFPQSKDDVYLPPEVASESPSLMGSTTHSQGWKSVVSGAALALQGTGKTYSYHTIRSASMDSAYGRRSPRSPKSPRTPRSGPPSPHEISLSRDFPGSRMEDSGFMDSIQLDRSHRTIGRGGTLNLPSDLNNSLHGTPASASVSDFFVSPPRSARSTRSPVSSAGKRRIEKPHGSPRSSASLLRRTSPGAPGSVLSYESHADGALASSLSRTHTPSALVGRKGEPDLSASAALVAPARHKGDLDTSATLRTQVRTLVSQADHTRRAVQGEPPVQELLPEDGNYASIDRLNSSFSEAALSTITRPQFLRISTPGHLSNSLRSRSSPHLSGTSKSHASLHGGLVGDDTDLVVPNHESAQTRLGLLPSVPGSGLGYQTTESGKLVSNLISHATSHTAFRDMDFSRQGRSRRAVSVPPVEIDPANPYASMRYSPVHTKRKDDVSSQSVPAHRRLLSEESSMHNVAHIEVDEDLLQRANSVERPDVLPLQSAESKIPSELLCSIPIHHRFAIPSIVPGAPLQADRSASAKNNASNSGQGLGPSDDFVQMLEVMGHRLLESSAFHPLDSGFYSNTDKSIDPGHSKVAGAINTSQFPGIHGVFPGTVDAFINWDKVPTSIYQELVFETVKELARQVEAESAEFMTQSQDLSYSTSPSLGGHAHPSQPMYFHPLSHTAFNLSVSQTSHDHSTHAHHHKTTASPHFSSLPNSGLDAPSSFVSYLPAIDDKIPVVYSPTCLGWVLLNYPTDDEQLEGLEKTLRGEENIKEPVTSLCETMKKTHNFLDPILQSTDAANTSQDSVQDAYGHDRSNGAINPTSHSNSHFSNSKGLDSVEPEELPITVETLMATLDALDSFPFPNTSTDGPKNESTTCHLESLYTLKTALKNQFANLPLPLTSESIRKSILSVLSQALETSDPYMKVDNVPFRRQGTTAPDMSTPLSPLLDSPYPHINDHDSPTMRIDDPNSVFDVDPQPDSEPSEPIQPKDLRKDYIQAVYILDAPIENIIRRASGWRLDKKSMAHLTKETYGQPIVWGKHFVPSTASNVETVKNDAGEVIHAYDIPNVNILAEKFGVEVGPTPSVISQGYLHHSSGDMIPGVPQGPVFYHMETSPPHLAFPRPNDLILVAAYDMGVAPGSDGCLVVWEAGLGGVSSLPSVSQQSFTEQLGVVLEKWSAVTKPNLLSKLGQKAVVVPLTQRGVSDLAPPDASWLAATSNSLLSQNRSLVPLSHVHPQNVDSIRNDSTIARISSTSFTTSNLVGLENKLYPLQLQGPYAVPLPGHSIPISQEDRTSLYATHATNVAIPLDITLNPTTTQMLRSQAPGATVHNLQQQQPVLIMAERQQLSPSGSLGSSSPEHPKPTMSLSPSDRIEDSPSPTFLTLGVDIPCPPIPSMGAIEKFFDKDILTPMLPSPRPGFGKVPPGGSHQPSPHSVRNSYSDNDEEEQAANTFSGEIGSAEFYRYMKGEMQAILDNSTLANSLPKSKSGARGAVTTIHEFMNSATAQSQNGREVRVSDSLSVQIPQSQVVSDSHSDPEFYNPSASRVFQGQHVALPVPDNRPSAFINPAQAPKTDDKSIPTIPLPPRTSGMWEASRFGWIDNLFIRLQLRMAIVDSHLKAVERWNDSVAKYLAQREQQRSDKDDAESRSHRLYCLRSGEEIAAAEAIVEDEWSRRMIQSGLLPSPEPVVIEKPVPEKRSGTPNGRRSGTPLSKSASKSNLKAQSSPEQSPELETSPVSPIRIIPPPTPIEKEYWELIRPRPIEELFDFNKSGYLVPPPLPTSASDLIPIAESIESKQADVTDGGEINHASTRHSDDQFALSALSQTSGNSKLVSHAMLVFHQWKSFCDEYTQASCTIQNLLRTQDLSIAFRLYVSSLQFQAFLAEHPIEIVEILREYMKSHNSLGLPTPPKGIAGNDTVPSTPAGDPAAEMRPEDSEPPTLRPTLGSEGASTKSDPAKRSDSSKRPNSAKHTDSAQRTDSAKKSVSSRKTDSARKSEPRESASRKPPLPGQSSALEPQGQVRLPEASASLFTTGTLARAEAKIRSLNVGKGELHAILTALMACAWDVVDIRERRALKEIRRWETDGWMNSTAAAIVSGYSKLLGVETRRSYAEYSTLLDYQCLLAGHQVGDVTGRLEMLLRQSIAEAMEDEEMLIAQAQQEREEKMREEAEALEAAGKSGKGKPGSRSNSTKRNSASRSTSTSKKDSSRKSSGKATKETSEEESQYMLPPFSFQAPPDSVQNPVLQCFAEGLGVEQAFEKAMEASSESHDHISRVLLEQLPLFVPEEKEVEEEATPVKKGKSDRKTASASRTSESSARGISGGVPASETEEDLQSVLPPLKPLVQALQTIARLLDGPIFVPFLQAVYRSLHLAFSINVQAESLALMQARSAWARMIFDREAIQHRVKQTRLSEAEEKKNIMDENQSLEEQYQATVQAAIAAATAAAKTPGKKNPTGLARSPSMRVGDKSKQLPVDASIVAMSIPPPLYKKIPEPRTVHDILKNGEKLVTPPPVEPYSPQPLVHEAILVALRRIAVVHAKRVQRIVSHLFAALDRFMKNVQFTSNLFRKQAVDRAIQDGTTIELFRKFAIAAIESSALLPPPLALNISTSLPEVSPSLPQDTTGSQYNSPPFGVFRGSVPSVRLHLSFNPQALNLGSTDVLLPTADGSAPSDYCMTAGGVLLPPLLEMGDLYAMDTSTPLLSSLAPSHILLLAQTFRQCADELLTHKGIEGFLPHSISGGLSSTANGLLDFPFVPSTIPFQKFVEVLVRLGINRKLSAPWSYAALSAQSLQSKYGAQVPSNKWTEGSLFSLGSIFESSKAKGNKNRVFSLEEALSRSESGVVNGKILMVNWKWFLLETMLGNGKNDVQVMQTQVASLISADSPNSFANISTLDAIHTRAKDLEKQVYSVPPSIVGIGGGATKRPTRSWLQLLRQRMLPESILEQPELPSSTEESVFKALLTVEEILAQPWFFQSQGRDMNANQALTTIGAAHNAPDATGAGAFSHERPLDDMHSPISELSYSDPSQSRTHFGEVTTRSHKLSRHSTSARSAYSVAYSVPELPQAQSTENFRGLRMLPTAGNNTIVPGGIANGKSLPPQGGPVDSRKARVTDLPSRASEPGSVVSMSATRLKELTQKLLREQSRPRPLEDLEILQKTEDVVHGISSMPVESLVRAPPDFPTTSPNDSHLDESIFSSGNLPSRQNTADNDSSLRSDERPVLTLRTRSRQNTLKGGATTVQESVTDQDDYVLAGVLHGENLLLSALIEMFGVHRLQQAKEFQPGLVVRYERVNVVDLFDALSNVVQEDMGEFN